MAHIKSSYVGLWKPQDLTIDKINSQMMFVDNIDALETFGLSLLKNCHAPVTSIDSLRAINTSDTMLYTDGMMIVIKSKGIYLFERGNTNVDDGESIIAPTIGGGRWVALPKSNVGLGNVPNVATNDQTPTYTQSAVLANVVSGEKLSVSMGKIMKAIADLISHVGNTLNPHSVTKSQVGLGNVDNTSDMDKPVSTAQQQAINNAITGVDVTAQLKVHTDRVDNPHSVTKTQIGLGNVPNVATNDQTPTYSQASTLANVVSGEKLSVSMGKIMKAIADLISHIGNTSNPHSTTATQVGLGNVPNVTTNDQTPTYTQATTLATLVSGEKLSVSMGKIMKAITDLISHIANKSNPHSVTASQTGAIPVVTGASVNCIPIFTNTGAVSDSTYSIEDINLLRLRNITDIPGSTNLDNYLTVGRYRVQTDAIASTLINKPSAYRGILTVKNLFGTEKTLVANASMINALFLQEYIDGLGITYTRRMVVSYDDYDERYGIATGSWQRLTSATSVASAATE